MYVIDIFQGRLINVTNLEQFMDTVSDNLQALEQRLACMADDVHDNIQARRSAEDRLVGSLFEEPSNGGTNGPNDVNVSSADVGFVNMIRTGILSLTLLPGNR